MRVEAPALVVIATCILVACGSDTATPGGDAPAVDASTADAAHDASTGDDAHGAHDSAAPDDSAVDASDPVDGVATDASACPPTAATPYDARILCDHPVAFWAMHAASASEPDLTGGGHAGTYAPGVPTLTTLPNGDPAPDFDGETQYLTIPSSAAFSITTTGSLTWEAWVRPDVLQFPSDDGESGYVDWMGKCADYAPTCEWEARMYDLTTQESPNRPSRFSAYVFNPTAGLGSSADWQPAKNVIAAGQWHLVVGAYSTKTQPANCPSSSGYPGSIEIWVDGVQWDRASHGDTGCMSQYSIKPVAGPSPVNIGSMAKDSWFKGAIAKVAIYDSVLDAAHIAAHYTAMTGKTPTGSCADTCSF